MAQAFKGSLYFLVAAPGVFLLSLIPLVGPPLAAALGRARARLPADRRPLARRGRDFRARRLAPPLARGEHGLRPGRPGDADRPAREPPASVAALAVGGTLLVLEFEEGLPAPDPGLPEGAPPASPA